MSIKESIIQKSNSIQTKKNRRDRKDKGVFYTPPQVVERITEKLLSEVDLAANPYIRIMDPACGTGLFLIKAFEVLKRKFEGDYEVILDRNKELEGVLKKEGIGSFILENNLWGADIDREALDAASEMLMKLAGRESKVNLVCCDSLISGSTAQEYQLWNSSYDYIIGNPPYIGHKQAAGEYKQALQQLYGGIYRDKSDISYCFIKKGIDLLKDGGSLSFVTSRYFMEGPSAAGLRKFIAGHCTVTEVVDFYGDKVFRDAGVAACIITLRKGIHDVETSVLKRRQGIKVNEPELFVPSNFEHFTVNRAELKDEGWVLLSPEKYEVFSMAEAGGSLSLEEIADSYQGIITGCDKAFILSRSEIEENKIEEVLLKPWIKNSNIQKYGIKPADKLLIYSDFIKEEKDFPNAISYISRYRNKLLNRRECRKGIRKWYQLQWGRTNEVFDTPKIVYPFKSPSSRFAVDESGNYCSADVYSLKLKKEYEGRITLEYIAAVLNSRLLEFYFKCYAKKVSKELYDYYPNTVLRMKIPMPSAANPIGELASKLKNCKNEDARKAVTYEIDREIYRLYGLSEKQIRIIEKEIIKE
ncbi:MAG TPA: N-6 DNA methylase [Clostridia bacterium]|nr:N-6 DNA methylase [Bacillota bacterium]HRS21291.1 N-6 DNA methylase [Clostridia bacterium]